MKPARDISCLIEIMAALRHPQTGCPWDIEQTYESIIPYTIEEAYEVADAIRRDDRLDLMEELGDLLLQVVYYARIAEEEGAFSFGDVVEAVTTKMIRRHPHVFGTSEQRENGMAEGQWQRIKLEEKAERRQKRLLSGLADDTPQNFLDNVSSAFPPALEAQKLQEKAATVGFDWNEAKRVMGKLREETDELTEAIHLDDREKILAEYGDLYFTLINLARKLDIDADCALQKTNRKFRKRFSYIETHFKEKNKELSDADLDEMEALWCQAKLSD